MLYLSLRCFETNGFGYFYIRFVGLSLESVEKVVRNFMYIKNVLLHTLAKRLSEHQPLLHTSR